MPLVTPHLLQVSGMFELNLFNFSGVIYTLINHLYCRSLRCVLPHPVWAALHALRQCSSDSSPCRSVFHAISLDISNQQIIKFRDDDLSKRIFYKDFLQLVGDETYHGFDLF